MRGNRNQSHNDLQNVSEVEVACPPPPRHTPPPPPAWFRAYGARSLSHQIFLAYTYCDMGLLYIYALVLYIKNSLDSPIFCNFEIYVVYNNK